MLLFPYILTDIMSFLLEFRLNLSYSSKSASRNVKLGKSTTESNSFLIRMQQKNDKIRPKKLKSDWIKLSHSKNE
jgi:hypothetical protein